MSNIEVEPTKQPDEQLEESSQEGLDRRTVLKTGAVIGAAAIITTKKSAVFAQSTATTIAPPAPCGTTVPVSPPTTPFVDDLPIPPPAIPTLLNPFPTKSANIAAGEAARADHDRWEQFPPLLQYRMVAAPSLHKHHRDLAPSYVWTFNGRYPAPTPLNYYGVPTVVRFVNNLPENGTHNTFGTSELTIHLHNGHTASASDGFAGDFFGPGLFKDNHYVNIYAGLDEFGGIGDPREAMYTYWFHDHRADFTSPNNYLGLNGMFLMYDSRDPSHELASPGSLRLPNYYGVTDIPLILTDKTFCPLANGRNEVFQVPGSQPELGDKWIVNGKIQPKFKVRRRKYRFRILNTGPQRIFWLRLIGPDGNQAPWTVVASDANLLESPAVISDRELISFVATRFDVIVDFAQFPAGSSVYLMNDHVDSQNVGVAVPDPLTQTDGEFKDLPIGKVLMRFDVVERESWFPPDTPPLPAVLTQMPDPIVPDSTFEWNFTEVDGRFLVNGLEFDHNRVDHVVLRGSAEEWSLGNDVRSSDWAHPIHIHFEEGRWVKRTIRVGDTDEFRDDPLMPEEQGRRDIYPLLPGVRITMRMRFRDFAGRYLIHCHNMNHEDRAMMVRWDIVDTVEELTRRRREIDERRMLAGLAPQYKHGVLV